MVEIGQINSLRVKKLSGSDIFLDGGAEGEIFLPGKYIRRKYQPGEEIEVFVYLDKELRMLATTKKPRAMIGEFAGLKVVANTPAGAYLDWGLDSELFVPRSEQQDSMKEGQSYVVFILLSTANKRIIASSKLDRYLSKWPPNYEEGQEVKLLVYGQTDLGYKAVINNSHSGMIYKNEVFQKLTVGRRLPGFIKKIREDSKIDLCLQPPGPRKIDDISETLLKAIETAGGRLTVTDKSPPEEIYQQFGVSKKVFKKAIGGLYKKRLIVLDGDGIQLSNK